MTTSTYRKIFCWLTRRHFWHDYTAAKRCTWCGRIEVNRRAL